MAVPAAFTTLALVGLGGLIRDVRKPYRDEDARWARHIVADLLVRAGDEPILILTPRRDLLPVLRWQLTCAGVRVNPGDIVTADEDGVAVVPKAKAAEVLKKAQELDDTEHRMIPFIEKFRSIKEAVAKFGRI